MVKITLFIDKKEQVFETSRVNIRHYKKAIAIKNKYSEAESSGDAKLEEDAFEMFMDLIVDMYDNQFTYQQATEGIDPKDIKMLIVSHLARCLGESQPQ